MLRQLDRTSLAALALATALAAPTADAGPPPPLDPGDLLGSTGSVGASLIDIDPATGAATLRGSLGDFGPVTEIEFRADGVLFAATGGATSNMLTIDPETGDETLVGQHATGSVNGLEFVGDTLYGSFFSPTPQDGVATPTSLVIVDQATGALTVIGDMDFSPVRGLAYDESTATMYGVGSAPPQAGAPEGVQSDFLFTVDLATGATTPVGETGRILGGLEFGPDGILYGGDAQPIAEGNPTANLVEVDPASGVATSIGGTGFQAISGLSFVPGGEQPSPLPIPSLSSLGLALLAVLLTLAGVVALRRR